MKPINIKQLQRESRQLSVQHHAPGHIIVGSGSEAGKHHTVEYQFAEDGKTVYASCSCPWGQHQGIGCSHMMAAMEFLANSKGRTLSFWPSVDDAERQNQRMFYLTTPTTPEQGLWITSRGA